MNFEYNLEGEENDEIDAEITENYDEDDYKIDWASNFYLKLNWSGNFYGKMEEDDEEIKSKSF